MKLHRTLWLTVLMCLAAACAPKAKWDVWTVTETRRVLRDELPLPLAPVSLSAARNEWLSFQIFVRSETPVKGVDIKPGPWSGPDGSTPADFKVRLYREHQTFIDKGTYRNDAFKAGWYPDALIPARPESAATSPAGARFKAIPFDLPAAETHGFWVDILVPEAAAAGVYRGTYRVSAEGARPVDIPVSLTVWDFALPATPTLVTEFGSPAERLHAYYRKRAADGVEPEPGDWAAVEGQCQDLLTEHRLNAVPPASLLTPEEQPDGTFAIPAASLDALRDFIDRYHVNAVPTPHPDTAVKDPEKERQRLHAWLAAFDRAAADLDRPGILFYTYLKDEPNSAEQYRYVQTWGRAVREAKSVVKVLVVEQPWTSPDQWHANSSWGDLYGAVDIWCPLFSLHRQDKAAERQALGETIWTYTAMCQMEPTPWWQTDYPLLNYRVPTWMAWGDGMKGLLYWGGLAYWRETDDPWTKAPFYTDLPSAKEGQPAPIFNGDGSLVYPARAVGFDGIVPSLRLKALRDGIEDFEYLAIAERLGKAEEARQIVRALAPSFFEWEKDAAAYETARAKLAELITGSRR